MMKRNLRKLVFMVLTILPIAVNAQTDGDIWLHMISNGSPLTTRYLGDQLNSSGTYYIQFEIGQVSWYQSDGGIGKSNTDPSAWTWRTASWYANGTGNNKQVQSDFGNFQFTSTGSWYFAGRAKGDAGDPFHYANNTTWGNSATFAPEYYFTVTALNNPGSQTATQDGTNPASEIDLSWAKDAQSHNVMIVRKKSTESWTEPTQGTSYSVGNSIGSGVVVYNSSGTSYANTGLASSTTYDYKFYSENNGYYSAGVTAFASTASSASDYFRSKATGDWDTEESWESSSNNSFWLTSTVVPGSSATATTILAGHNITITGDVTINASLTVDGALTVEGVIDCGTSEITGSGTFTLSSGATIKINHAEGISASGATGSVQTSTRSFSAGAWYEYNGIGITGTGLPTSNFSGQITINNGADVTLSGSITFYDLGTVYGVSGSSFNFNTYTFSGGSTNGMIFFESGSTVSTSNSGGFLSSITFMPSSQVQLEAGVNLVINANTTTPFPNSLTPTYSVNNIEINGEVTLNKELTVTGTLQINSGKKLEIPKNGKLEVTGTISNNAGTSGLVIKSDATGTGSLIHQNSNVNGTVERYVAAANWATATNGWHLLSSPVASQAISGDWTPTGTNNDYDMYIFDESKTTEYWLNQKVGANNITTFEVGKGYLSAYEQTGTKTFTGALNVSNVTFSSLANTSGSAYPGYHLVGNPFSSAINWTTGSWTKTNIDAVAQVWDAATSSYKTTTEKGNIIPSMNGFMVHTTGNGTLTIPANARVHNAANWYKSDEEFIMLNANDPEGQTSQSSLIRFNPMATGQFDSDYDCYFLDGFAPAFYSKSGNDLFALNTLTEMSEGLVIPFDFIKNNSTSFNIELAKNITGTVVYLTDKKTGIQTDLTQNPFYSFTSAEGDDPDRFELKFGAVGTGEVSWKPSLRAWFYNGQLSVENAGKGLLNVYNLQGQDVFSSEIFESGVKTFSLNLPSGIYVAQFTSPNEVKTVKIIVQ